MERYYSTSTYVNPTKGKSFNMSNWDSTVEYKNDDYIQDLVVYNNALYFCVKNNTNNQPDVSSSWSFITGGVPGAKGEQGKQGITFLPELHDSVLLWSNNGGLSNPDPVDLKGDKGDKGNQGIPGSRGLQGIQGIQGIQGAQGSGLEFKWENTRLGVKTENDTEYQYTELRGATGIQGLSIKGDTGEKGDTGDNGNSLYLTANLVNGKWVLQKRYDEESPWENVIDLDLLQGEKGDKGSKVIIENNKGILEYRYEGEEEVFQLTSLEDLKGDSIKKAYIGIDGYLYIETSASESPLRCGYVQGEKGEDGREVLFQQTIEDETIVRFWWKYAGDLLWTLSLEVDFSQFIIDTDQIESDIKALQDQVADNDDQIADLNNNKVDKTYVDTTFVPLQDYVPYSDADKTQVAKITTIETLGKANEVSIINLQERNEFTDEERTKLDDIEDGAQVNPDTLPNPQPIIINGTSYDGSSRIELDISGASSWDDITGKPDLATVATSGDYSDLSNQPIIPTELPNPHSLTINGTEYDGSEAKSITISAESGASSWDEITNKPTLPTIQYKGNITDFNDFVEVGNYGVIAWDAQNSPESSYHNWSLEVLLKSDNYVIQRATRLGEDSKMLVYLRELNISGSDSSEWKPITDLSNYYTKSETMDEFIDFADYVDTTIAEAIDGIEFPTLTGLSTATIETVVSDGEVLSNVKDGSVTSEKLSSEVQTKLNSIKSNLDISQFFLASAGTVTATYYNSLLSALGGIDKISVGGYVNTGMDFIIPITLAKDIENNIFISFYFGLDINVSVIITISSDYSWSISGVNLASEAYVTNAIEGLEIGDVDLSNYYTKSQTDSKFVETSADMTIGGQKTFLLSPILPEANYDNEAVNRGYVNAQLATKVDKVEGKELSSNDFTDAEKTKLAGIEDGAEVNNITTSDNADFDFDLTFVEEAPNDGKKYVRSNGGWVEAGAKIDLFVDLWNNATSGYGEYNAGTGYFELNGITDIPYEEAINIYEFANCSNGYTNGIGCISGKTFRTNIPIKIYIAKGISYFTDCFLRSNIEVINFGMTYYVKFDNWLGYTPKLKKALFPLNSVVISSIGSTAPFSNAPLLEECKIPQVMVSLNFNNSPNLENSSILYIIENNVATSAITITLHPDAYERATASEEILTALECHPLLTLTSA